MDRTAPMLPMRPGSPSGARTTTSGTAPPSCSPRWRSLLAGDRVQAAALAPGVPGPSSSRSPAPTPSRSCTWSVTTTPRTRGPRSATGGRRTGGSTSTSPLSAGQGSSSSRSGTASSSARPSTAAAWARPRTSTPRSGAFIDGWKTDATRLCGPRQQTGPEEGRCA